MQRAAAEGQLDDELWSPEHDWILQFDKLLGNNGSKGNKRSGAAAASGCLIQLPNHLGQLP